MHEEEAVYFRNQLRQARATALRDAEQFQDLLFCIERLGAKLAHKIGTLHDYGGVLKRLAGTSPLARMIPQRYGQYHSKFSELFDSVNSGRNDALHQGAVARHLTRHAVEVSLILEDALMSTSNKVGLYMVHNPVCALPWQPLSFLRQTMLTESFSYLPVRYARNGELAWYLVSDYSLAQYLHGSDRPQRLATTLEEALEARELTLTKAEVCRWTTPIKEVLERSEGKPVLVCREEGDELMGLVTPFDLL